MEKEKNTGTIEDMNIEQECQQEHDNLSDKTDKNQTENDENLTEKGQGDDENGGKEGKKKSRSFFGKKKSDDEEQKQKKEVEELDTKYKELNDRFLRLYSEFDNYKKRTNKEKLDLLSTASEKVIVGLLPVIDDFERAIAANEKSEEISAIKEGFVLIYNKLLQLLKRFDVEEIQAKGEEFNTDYHEAITHFPAQKEEDKGKVMDVTEKGYKIKDKVIRYSKVVVAN